ncbi:MAG: CcmD family protein [Chitinophagaceae bacterium]|nr:CcmD family protein [Chitinophagaceae bacterium]
MKIVRHLLLLLFMLANATFVFAQEKKYDFGETMRSNGRIYVVVAVMVTILLGLVLYVVRLDRKISKLEKEN